MLRKRTFKLEQRCKASSWKTFSEIYEWLKSHKKEVEETFKVACWDYNHNEPMNYISLYCDQRNAEVYHIKEYAEKINELFSDNPDKIVVDFDVHEIPAKYRKWVSYEHVWFIKQPV